jgi:hypothetical protein
LEPRGTIGFADVMNFPAFKCIRYLCTRKY